MSGFIKYLLLFQLIILINGNQGFAQKVYYVGIPNSSMDYFASAQQKPQWCWAASIQMLMNYYHVDLDQYQIVKRTYGSNYSGELPNWAASIETIHLNLNHAGVDKRGNHYIVNAQAGFGPPEPMLLIRELSHKRPVIIGYQANFGGHVVLITAVSYYQTAVGPVIRSIIVRDPLPEMNNRFNNGRIEYDAATLASRIDAYWFVRVLTMGNEF
jgi:hypothetical protein